MDEKTTLDDMGTARSLIDAVTSDDIPVGPQFDVFIIATAQEARNRGFEGLEALVGVVVLLERERVRNEFTARSELAEEKALLALEYFRSLVLMKGDAWD